MMYVKVIKSENIGYLKDCIVFDRVVYNTASSSSSSSSRDSSGGLNTQKLFCPFNKSEYVRCGTWCPLLDYDENSSVVRFNCGNSNATAIIISSEDKEEGK